VIKKTYPIKHKLTVLNLGFPDQLYDDTNSKIIITYIISPKKQSGGVYF